jgi:Rps23 Pro-64 3,4-dihydroxylase Tpa1-like proline 4-hydroxylase
MRARQTNGAGLFHTISRRLARVMRTRADILDANPYNSRALAALPTFATEFQTAHPFKHIVIDGLFESDFLQCAAEAFYPVEDSRWYQFHNAREVKLAIGDETRFPPIIRNFMRELNSKIFLEKLGALTGITGLIPDPYMIGGGMHCIPRGGKLAIHADFNKHPIMNVDRRLNLLLYLNRDWHESYGGCLELWNKSMEHCSKRVLPIFNRTVIFLTDDFSFHGHPDPLDCPQGYVRKSIAVYYYTNGRPASECSALGVHDTLFPNTPQPER